LKAASKGFPLPVDSLGLEMNYVLYGLEMLTRLGSVTLRMENICSKYSSFVLFSQGFLVSDLVSNSLTFVSISTT